MSTTRSRRRSPLSSYKACRNCKYLVTLDTTRCPNCGSTDFSEDWSGVIIVLNPEISQIAKRLGIRREGMYAVKVT